MRKSLIKRASNRLLHVIARYAPGAQSVRPFLHRLRGVRIGKDVFIGDDVYLENEHPEAVEIQSGVQISVRAIILAHTRGAGRVVIERNSYVGPNAVIATSGDRLLRIGEGSVIGAGVVITRDVAAHMFVSNETPRTVATVRIPLPKARTMTEFVRGLAPIGRPNGAISRSRQETARPTEQSEKV
jgi:serine acetyltransferase